jgi:hypothetical protein
METLWDESEWHRRCLGCGGQIADALWRLGAVQCHDCRDLRRGVDPVLLQAWAEAQRVAAAKHAHEVADTPHGA